MFRKNSTRRFKSCLRHSLNSKGLRQKGVSPIFVPKSAVYPPWETFGNRIGFALGMCRLSPSLRFLGRTTHGITGETRRVAPAHLQIWGGNVAPRCLMDAGPPSHSLRRRTYQVQLRRPSYSESGVFSKPELGAANGALPPEVQTQSSIELHRRINLRFSDGDALDVDADG